MDNNINQIEKVFIAGAHGMVGSAIYRSFLKNKKLVLFGIIFMLDHCPAIIEHLTVQFDAGTHLKM